jgi:hypothetical protein
MATSAETYVLDIKWEVPNMPPLVGPFPTVSEAEEFARLNVPNGEWSVQPVHYPYYRGAQTR